MRSACQVHPILASQHDVEYNSCKRVYEALLLSPPCPCSSADNRSFNCDIVCELRNAKFCKCLLFVLYRDTLSLVLDSIRGCESSNYCHLLFSNPRSLSSKRAITWELCVATSCTGSLLIRSLFKFSSNCDWRIWINTLISSTSLRKDLVILSVSQSNHFHGNGIAIACRIGEITQPPHDFHRCFSSIVDRTVVYACHQTHEMFERKCPFFNIEFKYIISASRSSSIIEFISFTWLLLPAARDASSNQRRSTSSFGSSQ